jgi:uncharacterized membrane protein YqjE
MTVDRDGEGGYAYGCPGRANRLDGKAVSVMVANSPQSPPEREASTGELVKQLSEQVSALVRDELKMARLELTRKGRFAGAGMGMYGASGLAALYAIGCLLAAAIIAIAGEIRPWLAALIVGLVLLVVSAVGALVGRSRTRRATPPVPELAVEGTRADVEDVQGRTQR